MVAKYRLLEYNLSKWGNLLNLSQTCFYGNFSIPVKFKKCTLRRCVLLNLYLLEKAADAAKINDGFVVALGIGTVFVGLICIVILCKIIGLFCCSAKKSETTPAVPVANTAPAANQPIQNRQEIIAAVSAAVAEELGTDVSAIRILSFKKI